MRRVVTAALVPTVASAALLPAAALGKGASEATIPGPGLDEPISLAGEGQPGGAQLEEIAAQAGFFAAVFGQIPDPMSPTQPNGELGPQYLVEYVMTGPNGEEDTIVQDLYPYATPGVVSYVKPGQPFWTTEETKGGWFVAGTLLKDSLVAVGLPATPPAVDTSPPADSPWAVLGPIGVLVALGAIGAVAAMMLRRRPHPA